MVDREDIRITIMMNMQLIAIRSIKKLIDMEACVKDLDLYDIFKDFDRDGDGIVDDIDLDDPNWSENCHRNGWCVEDHDDAFFRAGRYRGLTEEEWAVREK
jgi:hypothetical protein